MHHPTDRITHTTAFVTPVVEHWLERQCVRALTCRVHALPARPSGHLFVRECVYHSAVEHHRADDDPSRGQVHARRQRRRGNQNLQAAVSECAFDYVAFVKRQA